MPRCSRHGLLPPFGAHFRYLASSWRSWALSWLILALSGHILSPSCSKMVPRWLNIAQHSAKMSQHSLQEQPQDSKKPSKVLYLSFFWFSPFLARSRPRSKTGRQDAPKSAPSWPSWLPSWPSWAHLGCQVGQLGAILAHLGAKRVTEDLKSAPGASIFNDFSLNFGPNSSDFSSSFL